MWLECDGPFLGPSYLAHFLCGQETQLGEACVASTTGWVRPRFKVRTRAFPASRSRSKTKGRNNRVQPWGVSHGSSCTPPGSHVRDASMGLPKKRPPPQPSSQTRKGPESLAEGGAGDGWTAGAGGHKRDRSAGRAPPQAPQPRICRLPLCVPQAQIRRQRWDTPTIQKGGDEQHFQRAQGQSQ